ncbi:hypothetical protein [Shinella sp. M27]|uniref:hypothetical protein n=1 Tax=Shinella sp. M27 TaxID=3368614 RepID=UPI003BA0978E
MRPYDVKTDADILAMESDNHPQDATVWVILNDVDNVSLHAPALPDGRSQWVTIPRDQFNAIVDWYMKDQSRGEA